MAEVDVLHDTPSGPAVKKLCERAWLRFGDQSFARLAGISVSHLYNLRKQPDYRKGRIVQEKTRPVKNMIGIRRKPDPQGCPGFIRIDTVHQGDLDGVKVCITSMPLMKSLSSRWSLPSRGSPSNS